MRFKARDLWTKMNRSKAVILGICQLVKAGLLFLHGSEGGLGARSGGVVLSRQELVG